VATISTYSRKLKAGVLLTLILSAAQTLGVTTIAGDEENHGTLMKWHKVEITFDGPNICESDAATFSDSRLDVEFERPDGTKFWVAGFFAGGGNEADTGNGCGNKWCVRLNPDMEGQWSFTARFRTGSWVAVAPMSNPGGTGGTAPDGETGTFTIGASDKNPFGRDFRGKGQLQYVNKHHCRFAESGEYFIKGGADSPEDFIADNEIDNTPVNGHDYAIHKTNHYSAADASAYTWKGGKGTGILGAIRYMGELQEMNNFYVILVTAPQGDSKDVFPWITTNSADRGKYDVSKLEQWERIFSYGDKKGIHWNLLFTETENDSMLCGNFNLCDLDRLYYREMIARFARHHAVSWNVGEEYSGGDNGWGSNVGQHIALMMDLDPYSHTYTCHTNNNGVWNRYDQLFGIANATSNQQDSDDYGSNGVHGITQSLRTSSAAAGLPMCIYIDEANGPVPRCGNDMDAVRRGTLWANLMAGGAGVEWYLGYDCSSGWHDHNCLEDFTRMECVWSQTRYALRFFMAHNDPFRKPVPFQNMQPDDARASGTYNWCFYGADDDGKMCVVVYLRDAGSTTVNVPAAPLYNVGWMNAKTGVWQYEADIINHTGGNLSFTCPFTDDVALLLYDWETIPDNDPPTPNPAEWDVQPTVIDENTITMTAVKGGDAISEPVQYYFAETSGNCHGVDSGWQASPTYELSGLAPGTEYCFTVKMRDARGNETEASTEACATTLGSQDTDPPSPNPAEFNEPPRNAGELAIAMSAVQGSDPNGPVQYYFEETSGNPGASSSGWQLENTYIDTGLQGNTPYSYKVKMRDSVCNEGQYSDVSLACTPPPLDIIPDGQINFHDLETLMDHWLNLGCCLSNLCAGTDLDASGRVDFKDYAILSASWLEDLGQTNPFLVNWWKLDEDTSADATTAVDSVGGNDGTINGATTVAGKSGNALHFDGTDDTVQIDNFSTANLKSMTIAFWMNPDVGYTTTGDMKRVISAADRWEAVMQPDSGYLGNNFYQAGGTYPISTVAPPEGEWTHVAMTSVLGTAGSPGKMEIYINGELNSDADNADDDWEGGSFLIGYRYTGGGAHYKGSLDDVRIYMQVLTEEQIKEIMEVE